MNLVRLEGCDPSSSSSAAEEKTVYVAVGKEPKHSESTLAWAIQNFGARKHCILHVHQPTNLAPLFGNALADVDVRVYRGMEIKIMQKKLDECLRTCSDFGVRADKVYIEMDSVVEGILRLIEKLKIKVLIMGAAASDGTINMDRNLNEPKSKKARHVRLHAPPFCTIYFICNGRLIFTRLARDGGPSAEGELPSFSMSSRPAEIEALCKVTAYEKLYIEEIRKRISVEGELKNLKDQENTIKETQDQKLILEQQIDEIKQQMAYDSELLRRREQERNDLQVKLDDAANVIEELRSQSPPQDQPRTELLNSFALSYSETVGATNRFNPSMLLGEYDHGILYKGSLHGTPVTVRSLIVDTHGSSEFEREVEVLSKFRHPNLATLMGANEEISAIVYEHLPNGSLEDRLTCKNQTPPLSWQARTRIVLELCSALIFLHSRRPQSVVHCALRPSCILVDTNFSCKIIGFDFARIISHEGTSSAASTFNSNPNRSYYTDPELIETGEASPKSDVYSFGIIVLQLLTGKSAAEGVVEQIRNAVQRDQLISVLDDSAGDWPFFKAEQLALVSLRCCEPQAVRRPDLKSDVLGLVEPMRSACGSALSFVLSDPPPYFLCPISYDVMRDPQVAADGHTYEADVLKQWLDGGRNTSPMTNLPLDHYDLIPNLSLRSAISEWREHQ